MLLLGIYPQVPFKLARGVGELMLEMDGKRNEIHAAPGLCHAAMKLRVSSSSSVYSLSSPPARTFSISARCRSSNSMSNSVPGMTVLKILRHSRRRILLR